MSTEKSGLSSDTFQDENLAKNCNPIIINPQQLPLCCPMPQSELWSAHPRVYLDIKSHGSVECPYCGARYVLEQQ